jgi:hypothetical protein
VKRLGSRAAGLRRLRWYLDDSGDLVPDDIHADGKASGRDSPNVFGMHENSRVGTGLALR